jgi:hypothetical protein
MTSKYDFGGNRTQYAKKGYDYNFVQNTRYDRKGQKLLELGYNGVDSFKTVYNYNKLNKLAEVNYFLKKQLDEKRVFSYEENITNIKVLDGKGEQKHLLKFTYNKDGTKAKQKMTMYFRVKLFIPTIKMVIRLPKLNSFREKWYKK